jgi:hypothetical protein
MPQRLSDVAPHAGVRIGNAGHRPFLGKPELATQAIEAIASWANVESFMLQLFVYLLGGKEAVAADMYLALDGEGPKKAVVMAAAKSILEQDPFDLFLAIMSLVDTSQKERNKLAHWTWGDSPMLPDAILLIDPRHLLHPELGFDKANVYVYTQQDFGAIIAANDRLCGYGLLLQFILSGHPDNQDGKLFRELSEAPEIRDRLAIHHARREKATPSKPPQSPPPAGQK